MNENIVKMNNSKGIQYTYSYNDYKSMFEKDDNEAFTKLIIPASYSSELKKDLNLIGKLPKDYSLDEIVIMKKYAGYVYNHVLDPHAKKDINRTISILVDVIEHLPKETEISISEILGNNFNNYNTEELFEINKGVLISCKEKNIILNFNKYKNQVVGLPFNIPFIVE